MDCTSWCSQIQANCPIIMWNQRSVKHLLDNEYHCTHFDNSVHSSLIQALLVWSHIRMYTHKYELITSFLAVLKQLCGYHHRPCDTHTDQSLLSLHIQSTQHTTLPSYVLHTINAEYQTAVNSDQILREHSTPSPLRPHTYQPAPAPVPLSPPQRGC